MEPTPLLVTNTDDIHTDALVDEFNRRGQPCFRFNTDLMADGGKVTWTLTELAITEHGRNLRDQDICSVLWRRPSPPKGPTLRQLSPEYVRFVEDECQIAVSGLVRSGARPGALWVSHPDNLRRANSKPVQLRAAASLGFAVPDTMVTNRPDHALAFIRANQYRVVAKVVGRSSVSFPPGESLYTVNLGRVATDKLDALLGDLVFAPVMFQKYIPKRFEIRTTYFGKKSFSVALYSQEQEETADDWRRFALGPTGGARLRHEPTTLPSRLDELCLQLLKMWRLNYGCFDFIMDKSGAIYFLELNANGQFLWIQDILPDLRMVQAWADLLTGAGDPLVT